MKIRTEQLQALQQQAEIRARKETKGGFDAILSEEIGAAAVAGSALSSRPAPAVNPLLGPDGAGAVPGIGRTPESEALEAVAESIDAMLNGLDEYAETLSSPDGANLRKAYGILQGMDKELAALRDRSPDLAARHAGMASLVDEIAVIARAETVKLNRGEYL
ncbi:MAG: hypothetical protein LBV01_04100 [Deltaproteobacteria bacterium]|jgi:hypothetical protein|nr:hypothetical protein [Deltaproteobacteria bacterium]